jgi:hypothetical protein
MSPRRTILRLRDALRCVSAEAVNNVSGKEFINWSELADALPAASSDLLLFVCDPKVSSIWTSFCGELNRMNWMNISSKDGKSISATFVSTLLLGHYIKLRPSESTQEHGSIQLLEEAIQTTFRNDTDVLKVLGSVLRSFPGEYKSQSVDVKNVVRSFGAGSLLPGMKESVPVLSLFYYHLLLNRCLVIHS